MKKPLFMFGVLFCLGVIYLTSAGCSKMERYTVNEPAWLQSKIDSIAAEKRKKDHGDTVVVDITKTIVGAEDCSSAWWEDHSQFFQVPSGQLLHFEFINHTSKINNWSNWNLVMATTPGTSTDDDPAYAELFVIRSDAYGWGNADYSSALLQIDYFEEGKLADWDEFKEFMESAHVAIEVDHASAGYAYVTATATNYVWGLSITETYNQKVPAAADIYANITTDQSHFEMLSAFRTKSQIAEIPDEQPVSITVTGTPASLELGETDFWGDGIATVTFTDGTTAVADTAKMVFNVPDLSTVGKKTIVYSYNLTKQGNAGNMVNGYYTLEVTNPVVSIEASAAAYYYIGGAKKLTLSPNSVKVTATYADGTTGILTPAQVVVAFKDDKVVYDCVAGVYEDVFTVTYTSASGNEITATGDLTIAKSAQAAQDPKQVGFTDCTTPWWVPEGTSNDWSVAPLTSQTVSMYVGSDNAGNWHSPCVVLRNADYATANREYVVVRMDNYGWGDGWEPCLKTADWIFDGTYFQDNINGSQVAITVTNNGDGTASIRYFVVYASGEEHFQHYDNIPVNSDDLTFAIVTEASYLVFD
ncbi:MAG: hypothetical protein MJY49_02070 [Bacteroidales bacterium]|nr:hypothetical protein [Bacteroidales bacterium]